MDHIAGLKREPEPPAKPLHRVVSPEDLRGDPLEAPVAADLDQLREQGEAQALALERIADEQRELGLARARLPRQAADGDQRGGLAVLALALDHQRHLAVVVDEADPGESLVRDPAVQLHEARIAEVDALLREHGVELHHLRLVLGADRPHRQLLAVATPDLPDVLGRIWPDRRPGKLRVGDVGAVEHDARVQRDDALGGREQWIDVDLLDGRLASHELAEADEQLLQRAKVDRLLPAHAPQGLVHPGALHHAARQRRVERRQPQGTVLVDLDQRPARSKEQHRPELRVDARAEDQLVPSQTHHLLDSDALEGLGFAGGGDAGANRLERTADRGGVEEVELDAPHVGLVRDGPRVQLHYDRVSDRIRVAHGFVRGQREPRLDAGDAVEREQPLRFDLGEERPALGADRLHHPARLELARLAGRIFRERRRLVEAAQVVRILPHVIENARCGVGICERRNAGLGEDALARGDIEAAHPARQHRLSAGAVRVGPQPVGGLCRLGHVLRREHDQEAIAVRIVAGDLQRLCIPLRIGVAEDVDGIAVAPRARKEPVQLLLRGWRQQCQLATPAHERVRRQDARPAGIGENGQAIAPGPRLLGQRIGHIEQVGDAIDAQDAAAAERGRQDLVAAGERAGVGGGGERGRRRASRLDHDDRLLQRDRPRRGEERTRVADRLYIDEDALRMRVAGQVVDQIAEADVQHRAQRGKGREAHVRFQAPVEDGSEQRAALAQKGHVALVRHRTGKRGVEPRAGVHHPQAVGANHANPRFSRDGHDLPLQLGPLGADLLEAGGDDDDAADACGGTLAHHPRDGGRGRHHHREVHLLGKRRQVGIGPDAEDVVPLRVHRIDGAAERIGKQVPEHRAPDAACAVAGADHRHAAGLEEDLERMPRGLADEIVRWVVRALVALVRLGAHDHHPTWSFCQPCIIRM